MKYTIKQILIILFITSITLMSIGGFTVFEKLISLDNVELSTEQINIFREFDSSEVLTLKINSEDKTIIKESQNDKLSVSISGEIKFLDNAKKLSSNLQLDGHNLEIYRFFDDTQNALFNFARYEKDLTVTISIPKSLLLNLEIHRIDSLDVSGVNFKLINLDSYDASTIFTNVEAEELKVDFTYGDVKILNSYFEKISIDRFRYSKLDIKNDNLTSSKQIKKMFLSSSGTSDVKFKNLKIEDLTYKFDSGDFTIKNSDIVKLKTESYDSNYDFELNNYNLIDIDNSYGDISLKLKEITQVKIDSSSSEINLYIPSSSDTSIVYNTHSGELSDVNLLLDITKQTPDTSSTQILIGDLNLATNKIFVSTEDGNLNIYEYDFE
ncbi:MAG: DUF4097 family beta strand repeat protein [Nanoarchaeales archaeon]|nr:DUF4097 family beta strand repeat protein [Nanoarchaeales archaeon]